MYPWVIIKPIYGQSLSVANKRQDELRQHLSISGVGDRTIGPSTRELATVPGTNGLTGNAARQELERRGIAEVGARHGW